MTITTSVIDPAPWHTAREQIDFSLTLLRQVAERPEGAPVLRIYRPQPTVAFSRRESLMVGFTDAVEQAQSQGFSPIIRPTGGRAVAYDHSSLVLDLITWDGKDRKDNDQHFAQTSEVFADTLCQLGIDARVGPVPGEYCPGRYSINARGLVKVVGTSQRVSRGARLLSASIPVADQSHARQALIACNRALGFDWDETTFAALTDEVPGLSVSEVEAALTERFVHAAGAL
jgi:octanoyl-[GcvH]:protein N-octanoyltransferase